MRLLLVVTAVIALAAAPSIAQVWNEVGDAGDLPAIAQVPAGGGPLLTINGTLLTGGDADMYCINIPAGAAFSATTVGGAVFDTQLWLFDPAGLGITFDDDDPGGTGVQSTITGVFVPGPGNYYVTVSQYDWDAVDPGGLDMWNDTPYNVERMPDGPGAAGPVTSWAAGNATNNGSYSIVLAGAMYCTFSAVEPATWGTIKAMYR